MAWSTSDHDARKAKRAQQPAKRNARFVSILLVDFLVGSEAKSNWRNNKWLCLVRPFFVKCIRCKSFFENSCVLECTVPGLLASFFPLPPYQLESPRTVSASGIGMAAARPITAGIEIPSPCKGNKSTMSTMASREENSIPQKFEAGNKNWIKSGWHMYIAFHKRSRQPQNSQHSWNQPCKHTRYNWWRWEGWRHKFMQVNIKFLQVRFVEFALASTKADQRCDRISKKKIRFLVAEGYWSRRERCVLCPRFFSSVLIHIAQMAWTLAG